MSNKTMTKTINVTIDIDIARKMLTVAGFNPDRIYKASEEEIFHKVLSLIECYGATTSELTEAEQKKQMCFSFITQLTTTLNEMEDITEEERELLNERLDAFKLILWKHFE